MSLCLRPISFDSSLNASDLLSHYNIRNEVEIWALHLNLLIFARIPTIVIVSFDNSIDIVTYFVIIPLFWLSSCIKSSTFHVGWQYSHSAPAYKFLNLFLIRAKLFWNDEREIITLSTFYSLFIILSISKNVLIFEIITDI